MSSLIFEVREHVIECQHIREYARSTAESQEEVLHLAVKQYIPLDNLQPREGDVTIIGAHANGFPKEMYEPLWEDLWAKSRTSGFRIRGIWIADISQQGASGALNELLLGNDPSWMDHARDLLHMVNYFRAEMPMPLIGLGHSLGANMICNLALMHPRLLSTVVLLDPVIQNRIWTLDSPSPVFASSLRRDLWPSRAAAEAAFKKNRFYLSWDSRVLDRWFEYAIRETPTALYPNEQGSVTLSTTKHQECFAFVRPSFEAFSEDGKTVINRDLIADMHKDSMFKFPFYRPEGTNTLFKLNELRPSALYIFGGRSDMSSPDARKIKLDITGTGVGGSGGAAVGRVKEVVLKDVGHLVAMEAPTECASATVIWLEQELTRYSRERKAYTEWTKKPLAEKSKLSEEWLQHLASVKGNSKL